MRELGVVLNGIDEAMVFQLSKLLECISLRRSGFDSGISMTDVLISAPLVHSTKYPSVER